MEPPPGDPRVRWCATYAVGPRPHEPNRSRHIALEAVLSASAQAEARPGSARRQIPDRADLAAPPPSHWVEIAAYTRSSRSVSPG